MMSESSTTLKILYVPHRKMWRCAVFLTQEPTEASIPSFSTGVFWGEVYKRILERGGLVGWDYVKKSDIED